MSAENETNTSADQQEAAPSSEHLNIKVTDNNNEVFFKIKRSTKLEKLMNAFCERQGKSINSVRFLFEGSRVQTADTPDTVRLFPIPRRPASSACLDGQSMLTPPNPGQLEMQDGDTLEVHQEQVGGACFGSTL